MKFIKNTNILNHSWNPIVSRGLICMCFFAMSYNIIIGQDILPINLETALELGGANNLTIQKSIATRALADASVVKSKEWWVPELYGGIQTHQLSGAAMNSDGRYALGIDRNSLWMGLGLDLSWDLEDGIYKTKIAKLQQEAVTHKTQAIRNKSLLSIIESYYNLTESQLMMHAYEQLIDQAGTLASQLEIQTQAGLQYQSDYLLAKSNVNHLRVQMLQAKGEYQEHSAGLIQLLNLEDAHELVATDTILLPIELMNNQAEQMVNGEDLATVYTARPELQEEFSLLESLKLERKAEAVGFVLPKFSLNAYISSFGGLSGPVVPLEAIAFPDPQQLYGTQTLNMSLMWKIPIARFTSKGGLKEYDAQLNHRVSSIELQKSHIRQEIKLAQNALGVARHQVDLSREGSQYAQEALNQGIARQDLGTGRPYEILQAQEIYINSRLDYIRAIMNYNMAQYKLYVASGNNL
ncbi:MAG: outer membrane protein TolC [Saprospiraceae bacterium]|jgi:outer membrane protein TolC